MKTLVDIGVPLRDPAEDTWNGEESHLDCLGGACGYCEDSGRVDCRCGCGDEHQADCTHCDGNGHCEYDGNIALARIEAAKREVEALKDETAHPLTRDGFAAAYQQMFGAAAPQSVVDEWWQGVEALIEKAKRKKAA